MPRCSIFIVVSGQWSVASEQRPVAFLEATGHWLLATDSQFRNDLIDDGVRVALALGNRRGFAAQRFAAVALAQSGAQQTVAQQLNDAVLGDADAAAGALRRVRRDEPGIAR